MLYFPAVIWCDFFNFSCGCRVVHGEVNKGGFVRTSPLVCCCDISVCVCKMLFSETTTSFSVHSVHFWAPRKPTPHVVQWWVGHRVGLNFGSQI